MRALDRKLFREVWRLRGQMISIALVVACGVMTVVTMRGTYESLTDSLDRYYRDYRFAHVFASLERAPLSLVPQIEAIPGVLAVDTRINRIATLDVPGLTEPALGQLLSVPPRPERTLNGVHLLRGRYLDAERPDEVMINESFAKANGLEPGDSLAALVNGRWRRLHVAGIVISPDYIGEVAPGTIFPDDRRYGIIRFNREVLAAAYGMEGAFDEVYLRLAPGASDGEVIDRLDRLLAPYGGLGAYPRARQQSHEAVAAELDQNRVTGTAIPAIFLGVAAFLLNIVLRRLVATQRDQIAVLKAFGYTNAQIGRHYLRFALASVLVGAALGSALGVWFGHALIELYGEFFRFPDLEYRLSLSLVAVAVGVSVGAATLGALGAVRGAVQLPPAEAMRPEAPARFRPGALERLGVGALLPASGRMILRNVERRPLRSVAAGLGVALSVAILVVGLFFVDAVKFMIDLQFRDTQREDLSVAFATPRPLSVRHELAALDGVTRVETFRAEPVRLRSAHRTRTTAVTGLPADGELRRVVTTERRVQRIPDDGLILNTRLARLLEVRPGDSVHLEALRGRRVQREVPVAGVVDELFGLTAYMDERALHRLLGEAPAASGAYLRVDAHQLAALNERLKRLPAVAGVHSPAVMVASFEELLGQNLWISVTFMAVIACILALGVIYNGARIALSERGRELASLRVLGFSRREVSVLLLGEQGAVTLLAITFGWVIGFLLAALVLTAVETDAYRIPLVISMRTYLFAGAVAVAAAVLAGLLVRRRLNELDLVEVLKTKE